MVFIEGIQGTGYFCEVPGDATCWQQLKKDKIFMSFKEHRSKMLQYSKEITMSKVSILTFVQLVL